MFGSGCRHSTRRVPRLSPRGLSPRGLSPRRLSPREDDEARDFRTKGAAFSGGNYFPVHRELFGGLYWQLICGSDPETWKITQSLSYMVNTFMRIKFDSIEFRSTYNVHLEVSRGWNNTSIVTLLCSVETICGVVPVWCAVVCRDRAGMGGMLFIYQGCSCVRLMGFFSGHSGFPIHPLRCLELDICSSFSKVRLQLWRID